MSTCEVHFIDCMGYPDLLSQFASLAILLFLIYKTSLNSLHLNHTKLQQSNLQAHKSIIRKLLVNIITLTYQLFLAASIILSITIFLLYQHNLQQSSHNKLNLWYKWSQIIFINILNILNLTVGFIYWKAVRAFFKIAQIPLPIIFQTFAKLIFIIVYFVNFLIIFVSLALLLLTESTHYENYQMKVINFVNAMGVFFSTIICLACRLLYQKHILNNLILNPAAIRKEKLYSILIAFSSSCRLICVAVNLAGIDYTEGLRSYDEDCIDTSSSHAIVIFLVTIFIDIIPPFIFNFIFSCSQTQTKIHTEISEYLCKDKSESVRYV